MQKTKISFPAKCFMWGEYLALYKSKAILATSFPGFTLYAKEGKGTCPFHLESAAGIFWQEKKDFFSTREVLFEDPYKMGGLGRSSAEFAALFSLWHRNFFPNTEERTFILEAYGEYRKIHRDQTSPPSGLDLVAQLLSSSLFREDTDLDLLKLWSIDMSKEKWKEIPSISLPFLMVATEEKQKTHKHLKELSFDTRILSSLNGIFKKAKASLLDYPEAEKEIAFCLKEWRELMDKSGLLSARAKHLCELFSSMPGVLGAKGSGAMGADILVLFVDTEKRKTVMESIRRKGYKKIYDFYSRTWTKESLSGREA